MKLFKETEDATNERKFIKSQVEKRRRERMNHSLERLRTILLHEPQLMGMARQRVEKAEILEQAVLFLQNTAKRDEPPAVGGSGGVQKHSFQDGITTCLQNTSQFLGPHGAAAALDASCAARFSPSVSDSEARSVPRDTKSILRRLKQSSKHRLHSQAFNVNSFAHPKRLQAQQGIQSIHQQQVRSQHESRMESRPVSQTLWRPWP